MKKEWHTYAHTRMPQVRHINESCRIYERVTSHIHTSHVTPMNSSSPSHECVTSNIQTSRVRYMNECDTYEEGMSHICIHTNACSQTYRRVMSDIWMSRVSHTNESCHTCEFGKSQTWNHFKHTDESCHTYEWVMSHIQTSHVTRTNESCHTYTCHEDGGFTSNI